MEYEIHVCPVCHEQAEYSDDYGWATCEHKPYGLLEPVCLIGHWLPPGNVWYTLPDPEEWKRTEGARLLDESDERDVARINYLALSCEERAQRWEKAYAASPLKAVFHRETLALRLGYSMTKRITMPCERCHDAGCENAVTKDNPNYSAHSLLFGSFATIPLKQP